MDSGSARTHIRLPTIPEIDHHPSSLIKIDTQRPRKAKTKTPKSAPFCVGAMADDAAEKETFDFQMSLLSTTVSNVDDSVRGTHEELQTTPLFSSAVQATVGSDPNNLLDRLLLNLTFPQYGLLAADVEVYDKFIEISGTGQKGSKLDLDDGRIFLNVNTPWSAFICGSQGSGKSHTLSCMLEDCLLPSEVGKLPSPLAGIVFHYDQFTSDSGGQICEAAYLCSSGIPVRVLVSPTNFFHMKQAYENLPGLSAGTKKPEVFPMLLREKQLDIQKMMNLMAVSEKDGPLPLYMEVRFSFPESFEATTDNVIGGLQDPSAHGSRISRRSGFRLCGVQESTHRSRLHRQAVWTAQATS